MVARKSETASDETLAAMNAPESRLPIWLFALLALLVVQRVVYHAVYIAHDPFAQSTFSDGQVYEEAARDVLAHPPLGSQPFFLQGLYTYLFACGLALRGVLVDVLYLQLALSALAALAFGLAASRWYGRFIGALCACAWLSNAALAFYENKYLSAELGVVCNTLALFSFSRMRGRANVVQALALGVACALSLLARPNLLLAVPFTLLGVFLLARAQQQRAAPLLAAVMVGLVLGVAPMAARNRIVTDTLSVFPSHGGGIPFYIGNHPGSTGLWNDAGGLISGQVMLERHELAKQLHLAEDRPDLDAAIGATLYARALAFMREQPFAWLTIEAKKLWYLLGDHEFVHDYDWYGERELLGNAAPLGIPFGLLLGFGVLGLWTLAHGDGRERALCIVLLGQVCAVVAANLLWFTSAQNRLPIVVPLAFAAGPGLRTAWSLALALASSRRRADTSSLRSRATIAAAIGCALLSLQAMLPRHAAARPSSAHYYNLANIEESLGRTAEALDHYQRAAERNPRQPLFWFRLAYLARRTGARVLALHALDQLDALSDLPEPLRNASRSERRMLDAAVSGHSDSPAR